MDRISQSHYWDVKRLWEEDIKVKNDDFFYRIGWVHIYTPNQFTTYLAGREIKDGEIVVKDVIFENTMAGFIAPNGMTKLSFSNSIAPINMANFFAGKSIDELDLTGLDMSGVISLNSTFEKMIGSKVNLTPIAYPLGILTTEYAFSNSNINEINIGIILTRTLINCRYMFASSTTTTLNFENSTDNFPLNVDMSFAFYNMQKITSLDLTNLRIWPMILNGIFLFSNSLTTLKLYSRSPASGLHGEYCLNALQPFSNTSGLKITIDPSLVSIDTTDKTFKIKCAYDSNATIYSYTTYEASTYTITL